MSGDDANTIRMRKSLLSTIETTPEQREGAAKTVATFAQDVNDCAELLDMLGLTPQDGGADMARALERGF